MTDVLHEPQFAFHETTDPTTEEALRGLNAAEENTCSVSHTSTLFLLLIKYLFNLFKTILQASNARKMA